MATSAAATDTGLGTPLPPTLLGALSPSPSGCEEDNHRFHSEQYYMHSSSTVPLQIQNLIMTVTHGHLKKNSPESHLPHKTVKKILLLKF
jgi:hypothetical protein